MSETAINRLFEEVGGKLAETALAAVSTAFPQLHETDVARVAAGILLTSAVVTAAAGEVPGEEVRERFPAVVASACDDVYGGAA